MGSVSENLFGSVGNYLGGQSAKSNALTGYRYAKNSLGSYVQNGTDANNAIAGLLLGDTSQYNAGYSKFLNSIGYRQQLASGSAAISGNAAASGLLNSGAAAKGLTTYGSNLAKQSFGDYISQLGSLASQGSNAAGIITGAGTSGGIAAGQAMQKGIANSASMFGKSIDEGFRTFADIYTGGMAGATKGSGNSFYTA